MPRTSPKARSLKEIYELSKIAGPDNVLLNDAEIAKVEAGDDNPPIKWHSISVRRQRGLYPFPFFKAGREPRARLSDVIKWRNKRLRVAS